MTAGSKVSDPSLPDRRPGRSVVRPAEVGVVAWWSEGGARVLLSTRTPLDRFDLEIAYRESFKGTP